MDNSSGLQARIAAIAHRKALEADAETGVNIDRLSKNYKRKRITIKFNTRKTGMEFTPAPKGSTSNIILFSDLTHVRKLKSDSSVCKKAGLGPFQYCLELISRTGATWHLVCGTQMDLNAWHDLFNVRVVKYRASQQRDPMTSFIERKWTCAKRQQPDSASFSEVVDILRGSFGDIPAAVVEERFRAFDRDRNVRLDYEEFYEFFRSFCSYPELQPLFHSLVRKPEDGMNRAEFTDFLSAQGDLGELSTSTSGVFMSTAKETQCSLEGASPVLSTSGLHPASSNSTYANSIFDSFGLEPGECLSFEGFVEFLVSARFNSIVDPRHRRCVDPMNFPLSNYYINSSHNTYLTGDQLRSSSSTNQYRDVLRAGCRCVEIDCWNGPGGDPIVYHGHTATSKIRFEDVIKAINESAFEMPQSSPGEFAHSDDRDCGWNPRQYPVILSLEVHTSESQSATMARMLRSIFGSKLLLPGDIPNVHDYTPAKLKGKILVKWKASEDGEDDEKDVAGSGIRPDRAEDAAPKSSKELSACVTVGSVKTRSWGSDIPVPTCVQSYVESAIENFYANFPQPFAVQNTRMLTRVYPAGLRVNSSNYDPMLSWRLGAHMVALNFQTYDRFMTVNTGFFAYQNGGCGYVLKPIHLRDPSPSASPVVEASRPYTLTIKLICGAHIGEAHTGDRDTVRNVRLHIHGSESAEYATSNIVASSFHPVWNETAVLRGNHHDLDVLVVRLCASLSGSSDDSKHEVGTTALPVRVLRPGYRAIPLNHPRTGAPFDFATIVCHVTVSQS